MFGLRRRCALALAVVAVGACTPDTPDTPDEPGPEAPVLGLDWQEATPLPKPPATRAAVRDVAWCGDHWVAVGTVYQRRQTAPAAWTSPDGTEWSPVRLRPRSYYGRRAVLASVACRGDEAVAVGAKPGGAHGNPRVMTFRPLESGAWAEVEAGAEQYGGPRAVNVGPIAAGPAGWLITGNRTSGPAVWTAASPRRFVLRQEAPGLASNPHHAHAQDGAWDGTAWVVVGGAVGNELNGMPQAWRSTDGRRWTPEDVPDTDDYDELHAVAGADGRVVAVGLHGDRFAGWVREDGEWALGTAFGQHDGGGAASYVSSVAFDGDGVFATTSDSTALALWYSPDGIDWRPVRIPLSPTATGDHTLVVAVHGDRVVLAADDAEGARVWAASLS